MIDRSKVEALVRRALREKEGEEERPVETGQGLVLPAAQGLGRLPQDPVALNTLCEATPARIAVGRSGTRYRTGTYLRFRADHAAAKDAVMSEVDAELLKRQGIGEIQTRCQDKRTYLTRPDLGRVLSDEGKQRLLELVGQGPQLLLLYGDGLSSAALTAHLAEFHPALLRELTALGIKPSPPVFIRYSRVKVMDEAAQLVNAEAAL